MTARRVELSSLLYNGERLIDEISISDVRIAITSHRALILNQLEAGQQLHTIHLPNIAGIRLYTGGRTSSLTRAIRLGAFAVVTLSAGTLLDLDGLIDPISPPAGAFGISQVLALINTIITLITYLDTLLVLLGLGLLCVSLGFGAQYARSRSAHLEVARTNQDPIRIPLVTNHPPSTVIDRVESALETASNTWKP